MTTIALAGWLYTRDYGDDCDVLCLGRPRGFDDPLSMQLYEIAGQTVSLRYWIADREITRDDAVTAVLHALDGVGEADYSPNYSETTGYLWTDEELQVGGHDLLAELTTHVGKYIVMEIDIHEQR